jgi:hexosaminidase
MSDRDTARQLNLLPRPRRADLDPRTTVAGPIPTPAPARRDPSLPAQGYRIRLTNDAGVTVDAGDGAGEFYAHATLAQLHNLGPLPTGVIEDWPDVPIRGVMLDVSRDKVPTMETLEALIDRLAGWKVNQLQLYMEHTFAYRDHEEVWADSSAFTASEIRALDNFCAERHIELVPNQNSLGHMERWLRHDRYRHLAIQPEGRTGQSGRWRPPTTVDPSNPGSAELIAELLEELLPNFRSRRVHLGLDEPWELPAERFDDYIAYVSKLRSLPQTADHEVLIWGDIIANHADGAKRLPDGVTVCEWGYEQWWPFDQRAAALAGDGRPFWLCPGTSSWLSVLGRVTNAIGNCRAAARAGVDHGARGYLNTDWGDKGHLQYLPISEPGLAAGAAMSWCLESNRDLDPAGVANALNVHSFADATNTIGGALVELGDAHLHVEPQVPNMSILTLALYYPGVQLGAGITGGVTVDDLTAAETAIANAAGSLRRARPQRADGALVIDELRAAADLVMLLCRDGQARLEAGGDGTLAAVPVGRRKQLAAELEPLLERHRELWLARNRPGGLADSVGWLERLLARYRDES